MHDASRKGARHSANPRSPFVTVRFIVRGDVARRPKGKETPVMRTHRRARTRR